MLCLIYRIKMMINNNSMSTEQIYKDTDRYSSLERDYSTDRADKIKFKIKRKIGQLENKACFFQGQLNPVIIQNKALRDKLVQLNRSVSASSDLLRNLLPVDNNPTRKLKLQIATIQQISAMIKEDWLQMKQEIRQMKESLRLQGLTISQLQQKLQKTIESYEQVIRKQKIKYETEIEELVIYKKKLECELEQLDRKSKQQKEDIINSYNERLQEAQRMKKQFQKYVHEMNQKCLNYERVAQRLRDEIAHNLEQFEKSKANIKQIYEALMQSKLDQQNKQFQFLMKIKQEQKMRMMEEMTAQAEQLKKKISQKNSQINHLSGINDKLKEQIGATKDELWHHKLELDKCHKQIKQITQKLYFQQESNRSLKAKIQQSQNMISQIEKKLMKSKQLFEKQLLEQKARVKKLQQKLIEEQKSYQKKIQEVEAKAQEYKRKIRENDQRFQQMLEEQRKKFEQMVESYSEGEKKLRELIEESEKKIKEKQKQILRIIEQNEVKVKKMEEMHENQVRNIKGSYEQKLQRMVQENQQNIRKINKEYQAKMSELQMSNNEYVRKLMAEHNTKIFEMTNKYKELQQSSEKQIKAMQQCLSQAMADNKRLQQHCQQIAQRFKRAEQQHKKQLEQQRRQSQRILKMQRQKLINQLKQQELKFQKQLNEKQEIYKNKLSIMQQTMQKQINMLKQSNAIQTVQDKYNSIIAKLKEQMEEQAKRLSEEFNKQLNLLSKKLEFDISKLNQELLQEKETHEFDKMTREEKIKYLVDKINDFRKELSEKDTKILDLYFQIDKKNKELEKIDEIVAEKTKKMKQQMQYQLQQAKAQFEMQTEIIKSECKAKVKKVQTQRIQFTQLIYNQFQELKQKYDQEMYRLKKKYDELERIFEERPSRAEDLSKIKQLIDEKSKMDLQIKQCKKKVKEANQIVKYLNLELENYKQTYDIFGPNGAEPLSPQRRYHTETDSPLKSLLRKQSANSSEASQQFQSSALKDKRNLTQSPEINELRLFPPLARNTSQAVLQEDNQSQISYQKQPSYMRRKGQRLMFRNRAQVEDKSEELKNNASIFLGLIGKDQKLPIEMKGGNKDYSRRMSRRRTIAVSYQKRLRIKDKTLALEQ